MSIEPPVPDEIRLRKSSRTLVLSYADQRRYELPFEYLRVYSPSAEVRGHSQGQAVLQTGKEQVGITAIEPIGHYAVRLRFDDGHSTGLYTWEYLHELATEQDARWRDYLDRLKAAGYPRDTA